MSPRTRWYPFVTFVQVTVDQFFGNDGPNGYGHNYASAIVGAGRQWCRRRTCPQRRLVRLQQLIDAMPID